MIRVAQIGDTHLGYRDKRAKHPMTGGDVRYQDTVKAWHEATQAISSEVRRGHIDLVIHTGDLFDTARPSYQVVSEAIRGLNEIARTGVPMVIIGGNHDTPRLITSGSVFDVIRQAMPATVDIVAGYEPVAITGYPDMDILCIPYGALSHGDPDDIARMVDRLRPDPDADPYDHRKAKIMVGHGTLQGAMPEVEQFTGHDIDRALIDGFDYVAMGHLHVVDHVTGTNALYNGSTNRFGFADMDAEPGWYVVDVEPGIGLARWMHHPLWTRAMIDLGAWSIGDYDGYEEMARAVLQEVEDTVFDRGYDDQYPMARVTLDAPPALYRYAARMINQELGYDRWWVRIRAADRPDPVGHDKHRDGIQGADFTAPSLRDLFQQFREGQLVSRYGDAEGNRIGSMMAGYLGRAIDARDQAGMDEKDQGDTDG